MRHPERVHGLAFMEAILTPVPSWDQFSPGAREVFQGFRTPGIGEQMVLEQNVFIERVLPASVVRGLTEEEMSHYRAPFADSRSRRPVLAWPREIPIAGEPPDVVAIVEAYRDALTRSPVPKLLFAVEPGAILPPPRVEWCRASLPELEIVSLGKGLHFIQEDHPHEIGRGLASWIERKFRRAETG
jgi:haloalkane dehalogenase